MGPKYRWLVWLVLLTAVGLAAIAVFRRGPDSVVDEGAYLARDKMLASPPAPAPASLAAPGLSRGDGASEGMLGDDGATHGHAENCERSKPAPKLPRDAAATSRTVVVGPDGTPVAGVSLDLVRGNLHESLLRLAGHRLFRLDGPEPALPEVASGEAAHVTTGNDGSFDGSNLEYARQSAPWPPLLRSRDSAWLVSDREAGEGGSVAGVTLHLDPAVWLSVHVVADADGSPIPEFDARISAANRGSEGFSATNGGFVVQWPRAARDGGDANPGIDATVIASAARYSPETRELRIPAGQASASIELRLKPSVSTGTLVVRTIGAPESLLARAFDVEIRAPGHADLNVDRKRVGMRADGAYAVEVTAGAWHVRLRPADGWANPTGWEQDVTIVAGRESEFIWTVPPTGTVRIEVGSNFPTGALMSIGRKDGDDVRSVTAASPGSFEVFHVPLGAWRVDLRSADWIHEIEGTNVDVRAGETAVAKLAATGR